MGRMKKSNGYHYDDEGGDLTNCADCGCMTVGVKGDLCSNCQEEKREIAHGKALTVFINDEYRRHKLRWPKKKQMGEKEFQKWKMKYQMFLKTKK